MAHHLEHTMSVNSVVFGYVVSCKINSVRSDITVYSLNFLGVFTGAFLAKLIRWSAIHVI